MKLPKYVEFWDDERNIDNGIIVTLKYGYSFEPLHLTVMGFDTVTEAKDAIKLKNLFKCHCDICRQHKGV